MPSTKSKARLPPPFLSTMPHAPFSAIVLPPSLSAIVLLLSLAAFAFLLIFFQRENGERQRRNFGSANGNRTRISALKGPRANRCTIAPGGFSCVSATKVYITAAGWVPPPGHNGLYCPTACPRRAYAPRRLAALLNGRAEL